jgi:DNA mismatch repair protein MutL
MMTIHELSPQVVAKIAAGEVIERPSYAIKELIENAIDARATDIRIHVEESGLAKLQVMDNGIGMSEEDLMECWKPHTTSKLESEHDLHSIRSFGFRGEALSSLGAISTLTIQSRQHSSLTGFSVCIHNGTCVRSSVVGMSTGTIVKAENLFEKVPARKKFLKSAHTELRHCVSIVEQFAMSYTDIQFTLSHGKKILLSFPAAQSKRERIEHTLGETISSFLIPFKKEKSYVALEGYIAKPQMHASTQNKQYLFVNGRAIGDKLIATAVKEAYGTMLESNTYPIFVLYITLPYDLVDINVHPRKEQVSFTDTTFLFQTVKHIISGVLGEHNLIYENLSWKKTGAGLATSFAGNLLKESVLDTDKYSVKHSFSIQQFHRLYIIVTTKSSLHIYDQHAAHERVLFEKLKNEFLIQKRRKTPLALSKPIKLAFTPKEKLLLKEHADVFENIGYVFNETHITHVPVLFQDRDPYELITRILGDLEHMQTPKEIDVISEEMLAFLACRAAVKAGDQLSEAQMKEIVEELETTPNNSTCPHGRPTQIVMHVHELDSLFKR